MGQAELDRLQASSFCLGVMIGMLEITPPVAVSDVLSRIRQNQQVSQYEVDLAISVMEALIRHDKPKLHQWVKIRRKILTPVDCNTLIH